MEGDEIVDVSIIDLTEDVVPVVKPEPVSPPEVKPEPVSPWEVKPEPVSQSEVKLEPVAPPAVEPEGVNYTIGTVPVTFPVKAYPSQVAIMAKIIKGLQCAQNCLLESPTGSGKTLALLCGSLAWQNAEKEKVKKLLGEEMQRRLLDLINHESAPKEKVSPPIVATNPCCCQQSREDCYDNEDMSDEEDRAAFRPVFKKRKASKGVVYEPESDASELVSDSCVCKCKSTSEVAPNVESVASLQPCGPREPNYGPDGDGNPETPRVPQIFYGTRTHKQIEQVVRELKKTVYSNVSMSILASREHMCIHPFGSGYKNKTEMCHDLLDAQQGTGCRFKTNSDKVDSHEVLAQNGCPEPWDIEDLVSFGYRSHTCPYFMSRNLSKTAELVFCPYNYLVDPQIQASMQLNLHGAVIIFDEAHNIEDMARESASLTLDHDDIKMAAKDCNAVGAAGRMSSYHAILEEFLGKLADWIEAQDDKLETTDYNKSSYVWFGTDAIASFDHHGVGQDSFCRFKQATNCVVEDLTTKEENPRTIPKPCIKGTTKVLCQALGHIFGYLYHQEMMYREDYRVAVIKGTTRKPAQHESHQGSWINTNKRRNMEIVAERKINLWCMNPAITMKEIRDKARSIILTSGTLAPIDSFSSELGIDFPIRFEANHVISPSQVWIGSIAQGPKQVNLNAQFKNAETFQFQDELGHVVLQVCRTIPFGVLCFFPSYSLMEKLQIRWQSTGIMAEIERCKNVLREPRRASDLEPVLNEFNRSIDDSYFIGSECSLPQSDRIGLRLTGALLLAVHRGKVSEGIDFADNQARAVIAVGIPYPNFMDKKVELKRGYNDKYTRSRGLLSGSRWYDIQAYRALNQALGRCIRHRNDWGAIILVDDRFSRGAFYTNGLSKWIRQQIEHHKSWSTMINELELFTETRLQLTE